MLHIHMQYMYAHIYCTELDQYMHAYFETCIALWPALAGPLIVIIIIYRLHA